MEEEPESEPSARMYPHEPQMMSILLPTRSIRAMAMIVKTRLVTPIATLCRRALSTLAPTIPKMRGA